MLDHEERFLFREEILNLANALSDPGALDNVEDLLAEVTTSPRFDSDVFTLERSLQVMLGSRAGSTLVGLLTVNREVFEEQVAIFKVATSNERFSFHGKHYSLPPAGLEFRGEPVAELPLVPRPVNTPVRIYQAVGSPLASAS